MATLPTYVITLQKQAILLPRDCVAEVIPYEPLQRRQGTPDWFLGMLAWRGIQVPVASFEMLTLKRASFSLVSVASASLVIIPGLTDPEALSYFAVVGQTTPRLVELDEKMLFPIGGEAGKTEKARVRFEDQVLSIPDLDYVEAAIGNVLITNK